MEKHKPQAPAILQEIIQKLATVDGLATSDAFELGSLIQKYGQYCAGDATASMMTPILDSIERRLSSDKKPWE